MADITQQDATAIAQTWDGSPVLQEIVSRVGMTKFQIALREMYNTKRQYFLTQQLAGLVTVSVANWTTLKAVANDRSDPIDRRLLAQKVADAIAASDATALELLLLMLINSELTLNGIDPIA
jgi:hypothetical protein